MIREKGGEDGSRCGYTKEETGERNVVSYEFYINLRILRGTELRLRNVIKSMECPLV